MKFTLSKSIYLLLMLCIFHQIHAEPAPLKITIKSNLGAGYFAELTQVINIIKGYEPLNLKELNVDWSQEFFPYKETPSENGWDLYFEPIVFDKEDTN